MSGFFKIVFFLGSVILVAIAIIEVVVGITGIVAAIAPAGFAAVFSD
jgi:hypothetical protein